MSGRVMKALSALALTLAVLALAACAPAPPAPAEAGGLACVRLSAFVPAAKGLSASIKPPAGSGNVDYTNPANVYWRYTARKTDGTGLRTGEVLEETPVRDRGLDKVLGPFSLGTWEFKLYGYSYSNYNMKIFEGTKVQTLAAGAGPVQAAVAAHPGRWADGRIMLMGGDVVPRDAGGNRPPMPYRRVVTITSNESGSSKTYTQNAKEDGSFGNVQHSDLPAPGNGPCTVDLRYESADGSRVYGSASCVAQVWAGLDTYVSGAVAESSAAAAFEPELSGVPAGHVWRVGDTGPAGGLVFYVDGANAHKGGLVCLETPAGPDALGTAQFGFCCPDGTRAAVGGTAPGVGAGARNTERLVAAMGDAAWDKDGNRTLGQYAAKICADYSVTKDGVVYDDWFLPSRDELDLIYKNLVEPGLLDPVGRYHWSSTEVDESNAWFEYFTGDKAGQIHDDNAFRGDSCSGDVRPVRAFPSFPYKAGDTGPAGGLVFYVDENSEHEGWDHLEAMAAPEGIGSAQFGYCCPDGARTLAGGTSAAVGEGAANTQKLVAAMGDTAWDVDGNRNLSQYAAKMCADYSVAKDGVVYDDWFLPSADELDLVYRNLVEPGLLDYGTCNWRWSSTEGTPDCAWYQYMHDGVRRLYDGTRHSSATVLPVRAF